MALLLLADPRVAIATTWYPVAEAGQGQQQQFVDQHRQHTHLVQQLLQQHKKLQERIDQQQEREQQLEKRVFHLEGQLEEVARQLAWTLRTLDRALPSSVGGDEEPSGH